MAKTGIAAVAAAALISSGASAFELTSADIAPGGEIAEEQAYSGFGCTGKNISPALRWSGAPAAAKSFALLLHDSDAPAAGGFWHWAMFDIPPQVSELSRGAGDPKSGKAPAGAVQGRNDFGTSGYGGPCPPQGDAPHHYHFMLFALDAAKLGAKADMSPAAVASRLRSHTLAKAELIGVYGR